MFEFYIAYKNYPYKVSSRTRFFNLFRYCFKIPVLEYFLAFTIKKSNSWWKKFIPPFYFYSQGTYRRVERNRIHYKLDISALIDHSIYFNTLKEPSWENLFKIIKSDFVIWDVGANIGFITLNLARICQEGFVFSFEPDTKNFNTLLTNIELNKFKNINTYQKALGAKAEKKILTRMEVNNPGANRILSENSKTKCEQEWVDVTTCDLVADRLQISRLDLLKIDVEGYELFVLEGAKNMIQKFKPILFVELAEVNLKEHGITSILLIDYIEKLNYEVKDAKTMLTIDKNITNHHTDILCFYKT